MIYYINLNMHVDEKTTVHGVPCQFVAACSGMSICVVDHHSEAYQRHTHVTCILCVFLYNSTYMDIRMRV